MAVAMQEQSLRQTWRALAAAAGRPQLELRVVAGSLEKDLPQLDDDAVLQRLVNESPAMGIARAAADRAHATVARERRAPVPDIEIRAGLQRNGEALDPSRRAAGLQGFAEVGVQIPLWNRNQGSVEAARRQAERAQSEIQRVELVLRDRAASVLDAYHTARILTERYRTQLLPRAQKAYVLTLDKYGTMLASYPQVLRAERMLYQLQGEYIGALESHWLSAIALEGLLLTDALEAPARPADVDLPVREVNMPSGSRAILRERP
jgi:cobalt-zinc-cadmium efflux system outer membrane protein